MKFYQRTWFIILALLIFAPLGIFLMYMYTQWGRNVRIILTVISILIFIPALISAIRSNAVPEPTAIVLASSSPSVTPSSEILPPSTLSSHSTSPSPSPSPSPISDKDKIIAVANKVFGTENVISVEYTEATHYTCIKAKGSDNLTSKMTVKGMYLYISDTLEDLSDLKDIDIAFNIVYPLIDKYGNSTDETVIKATFYSATRNKINWDNFFFEDIPDIADIWWIHSALASVMN